MLTSEQRDALKAKLVDALGDAAAEVLQVGDPGKVAALRRGADAKRAHLTELAIAMAAAAIAEQWAKDEATAAAKLGASYTELGAAPASPGRVPAAAGRGWRNSPRPGAARAGHRRRRRHNATPAAPTTAAPVRWRSSTSTR